MIVSELQEKLDKMNPNSVLRIVVTKDTAKILVGYDYVLHYFKSYDFNF